MCQVFYENLICSFSHLPKANSAWEEVRCMRMPYYNYLKYRRFFKYFGYMKMNNNA